MARPVSRSMQQLIDLNAAEDLEEQYRQRPQGQAFNPLGIMQHFQGMFQPPPANAVAAPSSSPMTVPLNNASSWRIGAAGGGGTMMANANPAMVGAWRQTPTQPASGAQPIAAAAPRNPLNVSMLGGGQRQDTVYPPLGNDRFGPGTAGPMQAATSQGRVMPLGMESMQRMGRSDGTAGDANSPWMQDVSTPANVPHVDTAQFSEDKPRSIEQMLMSAANNRDYVSRGGVVSQAISPDERRAALGTLAELQAGRDRTGGEDRRATAQNVSQERIARITADAATATRGQMSDDQEAVLVNDEAKTLPIWRSNPNEARRIARATLVQAGILRAPQPPAAVQQVDQPGVAPVVQPGVTQPDNQPQPVVQPSGGTPRQPLTVAQLTSAAEAALPEATDAASVVNALVDQKSIDFGSLAPEQFDAIDAVLKRRFPANGTTPMNVGTTPYSTTMEGNSFGERMGLSNPLAVSIPFFGGGQATPQQESMAAWRNQLLQRGRPMVGDVPGQPAVGGPLGAAGRWLGGLGPLALSLASRIPGSPFGGLFDQK